MSADPAPPSLTRAERPGLAARVHLAVHDRAAHLSSTTRALLWSMSAGFLFSVLNAVARTLTQHLHPMQAQFLRYLFGVAVMLPLVWRAGLAAYRPQRIGGQFLRGAVHALGLVLWFTALPRIPLADMTAIGFTGPIFIMVGAWLFLSEPMRWERWLATGIGFAGMLVVLVQPAAGAAGVAVVHSLWQWLGFAVCGLLGTFGHYCLTRSYRHADIAATQSVKFLDLIWALLLGLTAFGDIPTVSTLVGGALISLATIWLARSESHALSRMDSEP